MRLRLKHLDFKMLRYEFYCTGVCTNKAGHSEEKGIRQPILLKCTPWCPWIMTFGTSY